MGVQLSAMREPTFVSPIETNVRNTTGQLDNRNVQDLNSEGREAGCTARGNLISLAALACNVAICTLVGTAALAIIGAEITFGAVCLAALAVIGVEILLVVAAVACLSGCVCIAFSTNPQAFKDALEEANNQ